MAKSKDILPPRRYWTPAEEALMREHYATRRTEDLARELSRAPKQVLAKAAAMGLKKTRELKAEMAREHSLRPDHGGRQHQFKPGLAPWNKGTHFDSGGRSVASFSLPVFANTTWQSGGSFPPCASSSRRSR